VWVDSHCHLDFPDFADELDAVVDRARAAGVTTLLTICTHLSRFERVLAVAERFPRVYATVGVHPHEVATEGVAAVETLVGLARHPKVVGFGETGLDFHYDRSPRDAQEASFRTHLAAARATGLPVVIHTRNADARTMAVLDDAMAEGRFTGLLHCFSGSDALARHAVGHGLMISFSGILTFKKAEALQATAAAVPIEHLLVETDAPYLAPVPHRGKRNEPAYTALTGARLAALHRQPAAALARATTDNFHRLFRKVPPA
jgi:TatD DNase family protein